jgi:hypothetical protein
MESEYVTDNHNQWSSCINGQPTGTGAFNHPERQLEGQLPQVFGPLMMAKR